MLFFNDIVSYLDFTDADSKRLNELQPLVTPHFPRVVSAFYAALEDHPHTRDIFEDKAQVERLRASLHAWLAQVFAGPHDAVYFEQRRRIGKVHVQVGLRPHFMFGAMNIIRREFATLLFSRSSAGGLSDAHFASLEKILDIDLTIMLQTYWEERMRNNLHVPATLAAGLAHEIRNPLNAIGLHLTLIERRLRRLGDDSDGAATSIEGIRQEVRRMRVLTTDLVNFAKPLEIEPTWFDARDLLQKLESTHAPGLASSNIKLDTYVEGDAQLYADRDQIQSVLVSLMMNSIEAMEEGGNLTLSLSNAPSHTHISVTDDGEGIPLAVAEQVFDLFFTTRATGTGLGLPTVQKIVEAHQGSIAFDSKPAQGTTVTIRLPRPHNI